MKAKPIFIAECPLSIFPDKMENMRIMLTKKFYDYHVLVFHSNCTKIKFSAFYAKDLNEIKFNELKAIVNHVKN
jgi:hypothetical protein